MQAQLSVAILAAMLLGTVSASAQPPPVVAVATKLGFDVLVDRVEQAVKAHQMLLLSKASASAGATARGLTIPGNAVLMVFRNDFAVRMLAASVPAGIEAPLRFYVTENSDRTATLSWRKPSDVFRPYGNADLDLMAGELDGIFQGIADDATRG